MRLRIGIQKSKAVREVVGGGIIRDAWGFAWSRRVLPGFDMGLWASRLAARGVFRRGGGGV